MMRVLQFPRWWRDCKFLRLSDEVDLVLGMIRRGAQLGGATWTLTVGTWSFRCGKYLVYFLLQLDSGEKLVMWWKQQGPPDRHRTQSTQRLIRLTQPRTQCLTRRF